MLPPQWRATSVASIASHEPRAEREHCAARGRAAVRLQRRGDRRGEGERIDQVRTLRHDAADGEPDAAQHHRHDDGGEPRTRSRAPDRRLGGDHDGEHAEHRDDRAIATGAKGEERADRDQHREDQRLRQQRPHGAAIAARALPRHQDRQQQDRHRDRGIHAARERHQAAVAGEHQHAARGEEPAVVREVGERVPGPVGAGVDPASADGFTDRERNRQREEAVECRATHVHLPERARDAIVVGEVEQSGERHPFLQHGHTAQTERHRHAEADAVQSTGLADLVDHQRSQQDRPDEALVDAQAVERVVVALEPVEAPSAGRVDATHQRDRQRHGERRDQRHREDRQRGPIAPARTVHGPGAAPGPGREAAGTAREHQQVGLLERQPAGQRCEAEDRQQGEHRRQRVREAREGEGHPRDEQQRHQPVRERIGNRIGVGDDEPGRRRRERDDAAGDAQRERRVRRRVGPACRAQRRNAVTWQVRSEGGHGRLGRERWAAIAMMHDAPVRARASPMKKPGRAGPGVARKNRSSRDRCRLRPCGGGERQRRPSPSGRCRTARSIPVPGPPRRRGRLRG